MDPATITRNKDVFSYFLLNIYHYSVTTTGPQSNLWMMTLTFKVSHGADKVNSCFIKDEWFIKTKIKTIFQYKPTSLSIKSIFNTTRMWSMDVTCNNVFFKMSHSCEPVIYTCPCSLLLTSITKHQMMLWINGYINFCSSRVVKCDLCCCFPRFLLL